MRHLSCVLSIKSLLVWPGVLITNATITPPTLPPIRGATETGVHGHGNGSGFVLRRVDWGKCLLDSSTVNMQQCAFFLRIQNARFLCWMMDVVDFVDLFSVLLK